MVVLIDKKEIKKIKKIELKIIDQSVYFLSLVKYFKKSFSTSCSIMLLNNCLYSLFLLAKCNSCISKFFCITHKMHKFFNCNLAADIMETFTIHHKIFRAE